MIKNLSPLEQRRLFEDRGLIFPHGNKYNLKNAHKIQEIGYYKLKEFAYPFSTCKNNKLRYHDLTFSMLLARYYQDKNLRIHILHAIEDIEVNLNSNIADILGNYGAFAYLRFNYWTNRKISKFKIIKKQKKFKKHLKRNIYRMRSYTKLRDLYLKNNLNDQNFPSVWLMVNTLILGTTVHLFIDMSKHNKIELAKRYKCRPSKLIPWLKCLNFIRNLCAHNSDLIDIRLISNLSTPKLFKNCIFMIPNKKGKLMYSNSLANIIFVIKYLMCSVNPKYKFDNIYKSIHNIIDGNIKISHNLGFKNTECAKYIKCKPNRLGFK